MTAKVYVTGNIGNDPIPRFTQSGRPVLDLSIGCTPRAKNKQTSEWEDQGAPLWIRASIWDTEAEKWAEILRKGHQVTVEGELMKRTYQDQAGQTRESLELRFPRILGYTPKTPTQPGINAFSGQPLQQPQASFNAPAGGTPGDPWAANQPTNTPTPQSQQTPFENIYDNQPPF